MPDLSDLFFIWDVIVVLWFSTHDFFTGVFYDDSGYESIIVMMPTKTCTGKRCFPVRHWVTVVLLTPFFCILNIGETLSARCMHHLLYNSLCCLLYNLMYPFRRMRVHFFFPLGVVEYLHDRITKKKDPGTSCLMVILRCEYFFLVNMENQLVWDGLMVFCRRGSTSF